MDARRLQTLTVNTVMFWRHETIAIPVEDGVDDIQLALAADAWSRTYRSTAVAEAVGAIRMRSGLKLIPASPAPGNSSYRANLRTDVMPAMQLHRTLTDIAHRYGNDTSTLVQLTMEYDDRRGF